MEKHSYYVSLIKQKFNEKQIINSSYSLRAFAKSIHISAGHLSKVLNGLGQLSQEKAEVVAEHLNFSDDEKKLFFDDIAVAHEGAHNHSSREKSPSIELDANKLNFFSNILYSHILQICNTPKFKKNIDAIAQKLNIDQETTLKLVTDLVSIGCLEKKSDQYFYSKGFTNQYKTGGGSLFEFHKANIAQIKKVLSTYDQHRYIANSSFIQLPPECLPNIRILFKEFIVMTKNMAEDVGKDNADQLFGVCYFLSPFVSISEKKSKPDIPHDSILEYRPFYQRLLLEELNKRSRTNPSYSLRAFAKFLNMNPGNLSKVVNGIKPLSLLKATEISTLLKLSPDISKDFLKSVELLHEGAHKYELKNSSHKKIEHIADEFLNTDINYSLMFQICKSKHIIRNSTNISNLLGISNDATRTYLDKLLSLGLVEYTSDGLYNAHKEFSPSSNPNFTKSLLENVEKFLVPNTFEKRVFRSGTISISNDNLKRFIVLYEDFMAIIKNMASKHEQSSPSNIYGVSFLMFPWEY